MHNLIEGLKILSAYNGDHVCAEHDIIYAYVTEDMVSDADKIALDQMGWHVSSDNNCYAYFT